MCREFLLQSLASLFPACWAEYSALGGRNKPDGEKNTALLTRVLQEALGNILSYKGALVVESERDKTTV